jgi:uncharacterized protein YbjQ (UPF0145 family)
MTDSPKSAGAPGSVARVPSSQLTGERIAPAMTSTTFEIHGYTVTRTMGVVRGIAVRSRNVFGTIGGSFQTLFGGDITMFTKLCEETRQEAYVRMLQLAAKEGANAVVGVRYDANEVMQGVQEVLCYGTAVLVVAV